MQPQDRLHAMDAVRAIALLAGVVLHATLAYLPGLPPLIAAPVADASPSPALAIVFFVIHVFRMTAFFLIAGFFARMMLHRRGFGGFVKNRLVRIAVPLIVGWPIVMAALAGMWIWTISHMTPGAMPLTPPPPAGGRPFLAVPLTHLWFLYVLLLLYVVALSVRGLVALIDRRQRLRGAVDALVAALIATPFSAFVIGAPVAVALYLTPHWTAWFGVPTPDQSLIPPPASALVFAMAFGLGWLIERRKETLLPMLRRRWPLDLVIAAASIAICLTVAGPTARITPLDSPAATLGFAIAYALAIWSTAFAAVGAALAFLDRPSPTIRYVSDASYWIYIAHLPLVYLLQMLLAPLDLPGLAKFGVVLAIALPILLLSYRYLVRYSFIGAVLNGRRRRPERTRVRYAPQPA